MEYPFILLTGRTRDQWHSGTKTNFPTTLLKFKELNFCEINPNDAKALKIEDNEEIYLISKRGKLKTKALITDTIQEKMLFLPISNKKVNYLTNDLLDCESLEPDYNHSAVKIKKIN